ncbi:hypothetical protein [Pseudomonas brassicacearum]|uniref:hypothetical protein n=1 Tax=Pseudomonas brassicacearum TaxID=930166 RepID=UPI0011F12595|nr:hypothetical protein [Pseudomonas brassicacearum]QEO79871.1 hypothetical protein ELZ14_20785 [Pseudomonas brassicacearum]
MSEQTLQALLAERVNAYAQSERPRELIDEGIEKLFNEVVKDAFRSYGDFGGAIKEAVKAALPANVSDVFELQRYNALVANALRECWEASALQSTILEQADKSIHAVLDGEGLLTGEVSLRALLDAFVVDHKNEAAEERWSNPEVRFTESECGKNKFYYISFDPQSEEDARNNYRDSRRSDYELKHCIHVMVKGVRETGDRFKPRVELGDVIGAKLDEKKIAVNMRVRSDWERMVASLYFGSAILLIDCEPDDFSYGFDD